ncbi:unnamed protein product [Citrullus colocynthis]|uniref:Uncharacterized protein n=1 Tax=Citrullus colocynthis TaxID=252529 RepID=A0ABP0YZV9_9ROSI
MMKSLLGSIGNVMGNSEPKDKIVRPQPNQGHKGLKRGKGVGAPNLGAQSWLEPSRGLSKDESAISEHGFEWRGVRRRPTPTTIRVDTPPRPRLEEEQIGRKFEALKKYVNSMGQNIKLLFKAIDQQS